MASPPTKRLIWSALLLVLALGTCLFLYALKLRFSESLYSRQGSFAFFVTVTEPVIHSFPVVSPADEPQYHSGCGDGPKVPDQAIFYRSRLPLTELIDRVQRHIALHGYAPSSANDFPGVAFASGAKTLYVDATTADDGTTHLMAQVWFHTYR